MNIENVFYSISQASEITSVPQSTLRYWEEVFSSFNPHKTSGGTRRYKKKDIEQILLIKDLLYVKGFTIKGANSFLENNEMLQNLQSGHRVSQKEKYLYNGPKAEQNSSNEATYLAWKTIHDKLIELKKILE